MNCNLVLRIVAAGFFLALVANGAVPILGGNGCQCLPWYQCKNASVNSTRLQDHKLVSVTDVPLDSKLQAPYCGGNNSFYVCCTVAGNATAGQPPRKDTCGSRRTNGADVRVASAGQSGVAEYGEWPWQGVVLKTTSSGRLDYECACALIDHRHALTSARCVHEYRNKPGKLFVRLGAWNSLESAQPQTYEDVRISAITIHKDYSSFTLKKNIAILQFTKSVPYTPSIDTVCLPKSNSSHVGENCVVIGWDKRSWQKSSSYLQEVQVPILNSTYCHKLLRLNPFRELDKTLVCTSGISGEHICKGDGGNPLVCYRKDGTYALEGLLSWSVECGHSKTPAVYTKVSLYVDWISEITGIPVQKYWPTN